MAFLGLKLAVSIPDTVLEEKESPREKTVKLGLIARACAIYGVDLIEVYGDPNGRGEGAVIRKVLQYLETPQYLRKRLFPLDDTLRYAGVLPPLRIPSHRPKVPMEDLSVGEVREGVTNADGTVDVGLDVAPKLRGGSASGRRVTVRLLSVRPPVAEEIRREDTEEYWGYRVESKPLTEVFSDAKFRPKIATSRLGSPLADSIDAVRAAIQAGHGAKLVFGSPSRGLFEMVGKELSSRADFVLNLFPGQHVETVRTEEAVFAGLGFVSFLSAGKA